jgi:hypothetical protein
VLLLQYQRKRSNAWQLLRTALAALVPGFGLVSFGHVFVPAVLLTITAALLGGATGMSPSFSYEPQLRLGEQQLPLPVTIALWAMVYLVSITRYFRLVERERERAAQLAAPTRSRVTQATRHASADAA